MDEIDRNAQILWDYNQMHHELSPSDAILALGSLDSRVAERAADLWHQGLAPVVVLSGGIGRLTGKLDTNPEADKFREILLHRGVPSDVILVENTSTNTGANLIKSIKMLKENNINTDKVIIVTMPCAEKRTYATVKKLFPSTETLHTSPQLEMNEYPQGEITTELMINIMVGDTKRIETYPDKGFTIAMKMPKEVKQAMRYLINAGYDKQLPG